MLAGTETGLTATLQGFDNALQDVADDPSSTSSRQALLSEARNLVARFDAMDQRLNEIAGETRTRMTATADRITALGAGFAEINRQLIARERPRGRPRLPMLDQRDRLLEELVGLVKVNATEQSDGTTSVFIGTGQVLVLGGDRCQARRDARQRRSAAAASRLRGFGPM